jgi:hypothetical protein
MRAVQALRCAFVGWAGVACGGGEPITLWINHAKSVCIFEELKLCLEVTDEPGGDYGTFSDPIEGYEHIWGHRAEIIARRTRTFGSQGAAAFRWSLDEVVEDTPMPPGTRFNYVWEPLDLRAGDVVVTVQQDRGELLDGKAFYCEDSDVCASLIGYLGANGTVVMSLRYGDPVEGDLILDDVTLSTR